MADVLLSIVFRRPLAKIESDLRERNLVIDLKAMRIYSPRLSAQDDEALLVDVTYADDVAIPALCDDNRCIEEVAKTLVAISPSRFLEHGMHVNYKQGKSGIMACINGRGANAAREGWYGSTQLNVDTASGQTLVTKERVYRHLGGAVSYTHLTLPTICRV